MTTKKSILTIALLAAAAIGFSSFSSFASQNMGEAQITIPGEKKEDVIFPHKDHQDRLKDCQVCHYNFAQEKGAIQAAIDSGDLKIKQVMNKTCNKCHRKKDANGKKMGPTSCKACHQK